MTQPVNMICAQFPEDEESKSAESRFSSIGCGPTFQIASEAVTEHQASASTDPIGIDELIAQLCREDAAFAATYQAERDRIKAKIASGELRLVVEPLFTHPPHALAAAQAEVKRLRDQIMKARGEMACCNFNSAAERLSHALSTPADTSELDRLVADAGRYRIARDQERPRVGVPFLTVTRFTFDFEGRNVFGEEADRLIDAALAAKGE